MKALLGGVAVLAGLGLVAWAISRPPELPPELPPLAAPIPGPKPKPVPLPVGEVTVGFVSDDGTLSESAREFSTVPFRLTFRLSDEPVPADFNIKRSRVLFELGFYSKTTGEFVIGGTGNGPIQRDPSGAFVVDAQVNTNRQGEWFLRAKLIDRQTLIEMPVTIHP